MMVPGEKFEIVMRRWKDTKLFKMSVECIYISEQVLRFKITGGKKEMIMDKLLLKKTNQWKITKMNFKFEEDEEAIAMSVMTIQDAIEDHINPPKKKNWYKP